MVITGLALQNLRSHKNFTLKFLSKTTIIVGDNAIGKTSIIETLALLSTGNSFRANRIEEMINFEADLARVKGVVVYDSDDIILHNKSIEKDEIEIILTKGIVNGKRTQHRLFSVNGVKRRKKDAVGKFYVVAFRPEDMRLIEGSPSRRRNFLNTILSMMYPEYESSLKNYEQVLKRRNKLLFQVKENQQPKTSLHFWNLSLIKHGQILQEFRKKFVASFIGVEFPVNFEIEYDPSIISQTRIDQYLDKEIVVGHTLVGPHKDDIIVYINDEKRKLRLDMFGSRGQQRLGVLWLKFCELEYLTTTTTKKTLLLLDDILSELDSDSRILALSVLKNYQSVVTTVDKNIVKEIQEHSVNSVVVKL